MTILSKIQNIFYIFLVSAVILIVLSIFSPASKRKFHRIILFLH